MRNPFYLLISLCFCFVSCITEEVAQDTPMGNFETCWKIFDEHYCFFDLKRQQTGLDWDEVYQRYRPMIADNMTNMQLFEVLGNMVRELQDGHVNIYAAHDVIRYGAWFDDYPDNYYESLVKNYLGRAEEYKRASTLDYRVLDDNVGYIRCETFSSLFGTGNLEQIMEALAGCRGLIIDVRSNGGGMLTAAQRLASLFFNEPMTLSYICHKTGPGHNAFSNPEPIVEEPFHGLRWQKPVCILTNRRTYSAANSFVMFLKGLPNITVVGDKTGGGAGLPFTSELPNGWLVRFSACPMYDRNMVMTEQGIDPDIRVNIDHSDYINGIDTIIETARRHITESDDNGD
ncbi:MAG: S41 family peptidase [Alloprevotella sp.]|nr:S41 family peptidase [Alloprevotella sp.]